MCERTDERMPEIVIRSAGPEDVEALGYIGALTFQETFADTNTEEDMRLYLEANFNRDQIRKEMAHPKSMFYLAECEGKVAAYMKLNVGEAQTEAMPADWLELQRIYVAGAYKGRGVGNRLVEEAFRKAREQGRSCIWLGVWEHNEPAKAFYAKRGFVKFGEHEFVLGEDVQTDYLMRARLT